MKLLLVTIPFLLLISLTATDGKFAFGQTDNSTYDFPQKQSNGDTLVINSNTREEGQNSETISLPISRLLFDVTPNYDQQGRTTSLSIKLKPELSDLYQTIGLFNKPRDIVFIYPSFTQAAYSNNGFYDYYHKTCDASCLTVPIPTKVAGFQSSSIAGAFVLKLLNYPYVKDEDVDKNPDILKQYKRVIVLHNEYVTKKEFNAITNHPNVIYLYPNALYAEVQTNYNTDTITLIKGHGYPDSGFRNGFNWANDNSRYEYNVECNNWNFYKKDNSTMLNCYPEYRMLYATELLSQLQKPDPSDLADEIAEWLRYPDQKNTTSDMLDDFDIQGTHIPSWVSKPAVWSINGDITKSDFSNILRYLYYTHIIK